MRSRRLLCALLLSGCGLAESASFYAPYNDCSSNNRCADGVCDSELRICVSEANAPLQFGVRLRAANNVGSVPISFRLRSPDLDNIHLLWPRTRTLRVNVRNNGRPVPADMTLEDQSEDGPPAGTTAFRASSDVRRSADFEIALPEGHTYRMVVEPTGTARQQIPLFDQTLAIDDTLPELIVLEHENLVSILGIVETTRENAQLTVRAVSAEGNLISSVDVGHPVNGNPTQYRFALLLSEVPEGARLRIDPSPEARVERPFPTVQIPLRFLLPDRDGMVRVLSPDFGTPIQIRGRVANARGAVPGAIISFRSTEVVDPITHVVGAVETQATTDGNGNYMTVLYDGDYAIRVTSLESSASFSENGFRVRGDTTRDFTLPDENIISGIATAQGRNLVGATIRASTAAPGLTQFAATTIAGSTGAFSLAVDNGTYDVVIIPPPSSMFAAQVLSELSLIAGGRVDLGEIALSAPRIVRLNIDREDTSSNTTTLDSTWFVERVQNGTPRWLPIGDQTLTTFSTNFVPLPADITR